MRNSRSTHLNISPGTGFQTRDVENILLGITVSDERADRIVVGSVDDLGIHAESVAKKVE